MTKIRTLEQLQSILDDELAWRKKELSVIKSLVTKGSSTKTTNCHIRSGIVLLYAHWEGFIKLASSAYLTYIASQRLTYIDLTSNFIAIVARKMFNDAGLATKLELYAKVTDFFTSGLNDRCILPIEIETKSNLSSEVLREIAYIVGIDYKEYEIKSKLIDERLLKNRNEIAHGENPLIDVEEFIDLHETIINLLDLFSNQISNAANMKVYKRNPLVEKTAL